MLIHHTIRPLPSRRAHCSIRPPGLRTLTVASESFPQVHTWGPQIASSPSELREDIAAWSAALGSVLERMAAMHKELDLEDLRKSI